jgi:hypothetical protein
MRNYRAMVMGLVALVLLGGCVTAGDPYVAAQQAHKQRLAAAENHDIWREQLAADVEAAVTEQLDAAMAEFDPYVGVVFVDDATFVRKVAIIPESFVDDAEPVHSPPQDGRWVAMCQFNCPDGTAACQWEDRLVLAQQVDVAWQLDGVEVTSLDVHAETPFVAEGQITLRTFTRHAVAADIEPITRPGEGEKFARQHRIGVIGRSPEGPIEFRQPDGVPVDQVEADTLITQALSAMEAEEIAVESEHLRFTAEYSMAAERWEVKFSSNVQRPGHRISPQEGLDESVRRFVHSRRTEAE